MEEEDIFLLAKLHPCYTKIFTILLKLCSNLETSKRPTITGVDSTFTMQNRNDVHDMRNHRAPAHNEDGKMLRRSVVNEEEHTRETRNHIETRKRQIWH